MDISFTEAFIALFTIINPIAVVPTFLLLTHSQTSNERNRTALVASIAVMITLMIALFAGDDILKLFGIDLQAFRLAGMVVIATMAWSMLNAKTSQMQHTKAEDQDAEQKDSVAVVPLAFPMLSGAGSISLVINYAAQVSSWEDTIFGAVVIALVSITTAIVLLTAPRIQKLLGLTGMNILTRIFGLLLLAIAIGGAATALIELFPALGIVTLSHG
jgi:multiple antibiotic resistance protein